MAVAAGHSDNIEMQEEDDIIIYQNVETKTTAQEKDPQKILRSVIRLYRLVGVSFGLLCVVQAGLNVGLRLSLYQNLIQERDTLQTGYDQLKTRYDNLTEERDQLKTSFAWLMTRFNNVTEDQDYLKRLRCESDGFTFGGGLCYYISTEWRTWEESRQYCRDKQSDLMTIKSKEKQDFAVGLNLKVWLGLTDVDKEGIWKWVDGTPLTTPTYWYRPQPDNNGAWHNTLNTEEDCAELVSASGWNDGPCSYRNRWICERVV